MGRKKNKGASQLNESQSNKIKECAELEYQHSHEEKTTSNNDTLLDKGISIQHVVDINNGTKGVSSPAKEEDANVKHYEENKGSANVNQQQSMKCPVIDADDGSSIRKWVAFIRDENNKTDVKSKFALNI